MLPETNVIDESSGVSSVILWCPDSRLLRDLLDPSAPFVLCAGHRVVAGGWQPFKLPVVHPTRVEDVLAQFVSYDFVMPTHRFLELLPELGNAITAVQLHKMPQRYLDLKRIRGKELLRLLDEVGWHVMLDTPANDFGQVLSPNRRIVERAMELHEAMNRADERG